MRGHAPDESVLRLLMAVRALYGAIERFDARTAAALGVDRTAVRAINAMEQGPLSAGAIADALALTSGSVTALLDRLEQHGFVERHVSAEDARRRDVALTSAGRRRAARHFEALGRGIAAAFERGAGDAAAAADVIATLADAFDRAEAE